MRDLENARATPTCQMPLWKLGKVPLGAAAAALGPQPGGRSPALPTLPSHLPSGFPAGRPPSPLPLPSVSPVFTGALLCPRPDPGSEPPGHEDLPRLLPDRGAPPRHDGRIAQVRYPAKPCPPSPAFPKPRLPPQVPPLASFPESGAVQAGDRLLF